jgi:two-component system sensor histidine kinase MprB
MVIPGNTFFDKNFNYVKLELTYNNINVEVDQYLDTYAQRFQDLDGRQAAVMCSGETNRRQLPSVRRGGDDGSVDGVAFQCLDRSGDSVASIGVNELPINARDRVIAAAGRGTQTRTASSDGTTWRVKTVGIAQGGAVQIARDYGETNRVLSSLKIWLFFVVIAASAVSALVGWLIARRSTKPLVQLTNAAEAVATTGRLDVEVPPAGKDEPGRLARSFATMLAALSQSRDQQQQLVQDAGHELRTPLTSLRTNVETLQR